MAAASRSGRRDPRHILGDAAEDAAAAMLAAAGLTILQRNWRRRSGELDVVALQGNVLAIVEVRVRNHAGFGSAADSVDRTKQRRIVRTTQPLLQQQPQLARLLVRFDVIEARPVASGFELNWIKHAFSAE